MSKRIPRNGMSLGMVMRRRREMEESKDVNMGCEYKVSPAVSDDGGCVLEPCGPQFRFQSGACCLLS